MSVRAASSDNMASPAKKNKLQVASNQRQNSLPVKIFQDICVYIIPIKLPNQRVQFLKQLALKKGFPTTDSFRYQKLTLYPFIVIKIVYMAGNAMTIPVSHIEKRLVRSYSCIVAVNYKYCIIYEGSNNMTGIMVMLGCVVFQSYIIYLGGIRNEHDIFS